jgi:hypothetical protein
VTLIYTKSKLINNEIFIKNYIGIFKDQRFYLSPYNVNPELVNRDRGSDGKNINHL